MYHRPERPAFGFALSSEENGPTELVKLAVQAERNGLDFLSISDHFHPWVPKQGHAPAVWPVLGAIAASTARIVVGTGVSAPILRLHPVIAAQLAATTAAMFEGRFYFGVGTGEALNELVTGERWPSASERLDRLAEAISIIRRLWRGQTVSFDGSFYRVTEAKLFTLPKRPPQIMVAAGSPAAARLAGEEDGIVMTGPDAELVSSFEESGGRAKPRVAQITVCWDPDPGEARRIAREWWPRTVLSWQSRGWINTPDKFEEVTRTVSEDDVAEKIPCGPDLGRLVDQVHEYLSGGCDHVYFHQVGPKQSEFLDVLANELVPGLRKAAQK